MSDSVWAGDAVKALDEGGRVGGYLVRFGDEATPDLTGDYFTAATDFAVDEWPHKTRIYYNHGFDAALKARSLGSGEMRVDDVGVWVEAQLEMRDEYERAIFTMVNAGKMGWSSGTAAHLVQREAHGSAKRIVTWPLGLDASITPTPAEWRNRTISLKALREAGPEGEAATSSGLASDVSEPQVPIDLVAKEIIVNPQDRAAESQDATAALKAQVEALAAELEAVKAQPAINAQAIEMPNVNIATKRGDSEAKAIAYYLRTGDDSAVKASNATDMNIGTAADGGNAVPVGHYQGIIAKRDADLLAPKLGVMRIPGRGTTTNVPFESGTANEFVSTAEATAFDLDAPALGKKAFTLVKYTKKIQLSYELLQDEDSRLMEFLNEYVGRSLALTHNKLLITEALSGGTTVALKAATVMSAGDPQTIVYTLKQQYANRAQFVMRGATYAQLMKLSGDGFQYAETPGGARTYSLWGYPVHRDENLDAIAANKKVLLFGDFSYMGLYEAPTLTFLRDPYSSANTGQVNLFYYFRAAYGVMLPEAILYGTTPTA